MSEEDVEIVRRGFEAIKSGGGDALLPHLDAEIVWEVRSDFPDSDTYRGHAGMRRLFEAVDEVLDEIWYAPQELIDAGDRVVVVLRWGGRGKGSGVVFEERQESWVVTVREGRIVRVKEYAGKQEALEAAGLRE